MKKSLLQNVILTVTCLLITSSLHSQAPQGMPYQAVMRNADGSVMASSAVSLTFMIHDGTANGAVVYQESHALTSNAQGLVSCVVGNGTESQGTFASINWGSGAKFLHVMMGSVDLGTQQMLSVPYALYAGSTHVSVSPTGDTLTVGGQSVIVPGISAANVPAAPTSGLGSVVLPGNNTCANEYINVVGCNGQTSLTYDGRTYDLVEIGGQCWFAENLATDQYRNGDAIPTGLDNAAWGSTTSGAFAIYNNDPANDVTYGKLYNWYTTSDNRGLCPSGWHVPTDCEWMYLEGSLGMTVTLQESTNFRGNDEGGKLKSTSYWYSPNAGATNIIGFTALPGGSRNGYGGYDSMTGYGHWWSSTSYNSNSSWTRVLANYSSTIARNFGSMTMENGYSVRCLKDSEVAPIQGCTDGAACNFLASANQDDGSCLYQNTTCDDSNANTINDMIDGNCQCMGIAQNNPSYSVTFLVDLNQQIENVVPNVSGTFNGWCGDCALMTDDNQDDIWELTLNIEPGTHEFLFTANNWTFFESFSSDGFSSRLLQVSSNMNLPVNCWQSDIACYNGMYNYGNGVTDIDGNTYSSIIINGQEWMRQNLKVSKYRNGDPIHTGLGDAAWSSSNDGAYAIYNNEPANNIFYGKLYNWYAVNDSRGLCPTGWHVPSDTEWSILENYLGGTNMAGGKMKATIGWNSSNTSATNESGLTGLPGGLRFEDGSCGMIGAMSFWWSATELETDNAWSRDIEAAGTEVVGTFFLKTNGFSVRCIRD